MKYCDCCGLFVNDCVCGHNTIRSDWSWVSDDDDTNTFFRQLLLLCAIHFTSVSMFRFIASVFQTVVAATTVGSIAILFLLSFGGFIIPHTSMPAWLKWGFWVCPLSYGEIGLAVNEFHSPRWNKMTSTNTTIGLQTLESRGLDFEEYYYWISLGAMFGFALLFNVGFVLALSYFKDNFIFLISQVNFEHR
ncbi:putative ABC-2 type transporter, plant PDR ABC transporter associated [Helianthus annuus]|nr:putative ABC-2 type transporter, plant PDR ABC transporter associated [Helianthus annuus]